MTVLLIATVVTIYLGFNSGDEGAEARLSGSAERTAGAISRISP